MNFHTEFKPVLKSNRHLGEIDSAGWTGNGIFSGPLLWIVETKRPKMSYLKFFSWIVLDRNQCENTKKNRKIRIDFGENYMLMESIYLASPLSVRNKYFYASSVSVIRSSIGFSSPERHPPRYYYWKRWFILSGVIVLDHSYSNWRAKNTDKLDCSGRSGGTAVVLNSICTVTV